MSTSEPCGDEVEQLRMSRIGKTFSEAGICEPLIPETSALDAVHVLTQ